MNIMLTLVGLISGFFAVRNLRSMRRLRRRIEQGGKINVLDPVIYSGVRTLREVFDRYGDPDSERKLTISAQNDLRPGFYYICAIILDIVTILAIIVAIVFWMISVMPLYKSLMATACISQLLKGFIGFVKLGSFFREQLQLLWKG